MCVHLISQLITYICSCMCVPCYGYGCREPGVFHVVRQDIAEMFKNELDAYAWVLGGGLTAGKFFKVVPTGRPSCISELGPSSDSKRYLRSEHRNSCHTHYVFCMYHTYICHTSVLSLHIVVSRSSTHPSAVITEWRTLLLVLCLHQTPGSKHNATLTVLLHVAIGGGPRVAPESSKSSS